jgi:hypothetical protein
MGHKQGNGFWEKKRTDISASRRQEIKIYQTVGC